MLPVSRRGYVYVCVYVCANPCVLCPVCVIYALALKYNFYAWHCQTYPLTAGIARIAGLSAPSPVPVLVLVFPAHWQHLY